MKKELDEIDSCPACKANWREEVSGIRYSRVIGIEYDARSSEHYDGISEWMCPECKTRWGRWTGKVLLVGESEPRPRVRKRSRW